MFNAERKIHGLKASFEAVTHKFLQAVGPYESIVLIDEAIQETMVPQDVRRMCSGVVFGEIIERLIEEDTSFVEILSNLVALDQQGRISMEGFVDAVSVVREMEKAASWL